MEANLVQRTFKVMLVFLFRGERRRREIKAKKKDLQLYAVSP
jgi:hypothetical protein